MIKGYLNRTGFIRLLILLLAVGIIPFMKTGIVAAVFENYTITPESIPSAPYINYTTYNSDTHDYYVFKDILDRCEKNGGGVVTVTAGTYTISNVLCIPSNVTLILEDGVLILKGTRTGTAKFSASKSIFQLIKPSKLYTKGYYHKYDGEKDIRIVGHGNATIDLLSVKDSIAFILGHNQFINISGITFRNLNTGHFIEMDASKNVTITNCSFLNSVESPKHNKEAINIDTPDALTGGFNCIWSSQDKTPDADVKIDYCTFQSIDCAIGTHRYSQELDVNGKYTSNIYHTGITISNCLFYDIRNYVFDVINWKNVDITGCFITGGSFQQNTAPYTIYSTVLRLKGADNLSFRNNICSNVGYIARATHMIPAAGDYNALYTDLKLRLNTQNMKDLIFNNSYTDVKNCLIDTSFFDLESIEADSAYSIYLRYATANIRHDRIAVYVGLDYRTYADRNGSTK